MRYGAQMCLASMQVDCKYLSSAKGLLEQKSGKYFELWNAQAQHYVGEGSAG